MAKKLTISEMNKIAKSRGGKCLSNNYINGRTNLLWLCSKGHKWEATPENIKGGTWCPYCAGKKTDLKSSLKYLHPKLASEWNILKNINIKPEEMRPGSGKKVWWICKKKHEWKAVIQSRVAGSNCPYCSKKKPSGEYNFLKYFPKQSDEWHHKKNKGLKPEDVTPKTNKKVWWICKKKHEYEASISHRAEGQGCPYCSGRYATYDYNLKTKHPDLLIEWHPKKNGNLEPSKFRPGSSKKVWWLCKNRHEWRATISSRALRGTNCPSCSSQSSAPEIRLFCELKTIFSNIKHRDKKDNIENAFSSELRRILLKNNPDPLNVLGVLLTCYYKF